MKFVFEAVLRFFFRPNILQMVVQVWHRFLVRALTNLQQRLKQMVVLPV